MQYKDLENPGSLNKDDIVIAIMGPTGVGKSNIIDKLTGEAKRVGHLLDSCTSAVGAVRITGHWKYGDRIVVVDTPGFDDDKKTDQEILQIIAEWLITTHKAGVFLHGIVYVQRITDVRMPGAHHRNLLMCAELCGKQAAKKVLFVTTRWDEVEKFDTRERGIVRESDLKEYYWRNLGLGDSCERFYNTSDSAWNIINSLLLRPVEPIALQLQVEMGDPNRALETTKAALALDTPLQITPTKVEQGKNDTSQKRMQLTRKEGREGVHYTGVVNWNMNSDTDQVRDGDIIILVMGETGVGKSAFINTLLGKEWMKVGHSFDVCTREIQVAILDSFSGQDNFPGHRLVIVEVPDFESVARHKVHEIEAIARWLSNVGRKQISGIVCLHDIRLPRFFSAEKRLADLARFFGDFKLVIGTTKWNKGMEADGARTEEELEQSYATLINKGASVCRFEGGHESAWTFVEPILQNIKQLKLMDIPVQTRSGAGRPIQTLEPEPELELSTWRRFLSQLVFWVRKRKD